MIPVTKVRERCKEMALRFGYPLYLFNRIPIFIFHYFKSNNPLDHYQGSFSQLDYIIIFMLINSITADLMIAFYAAGDQIVDDIFKLHAIFINAWKLHKAASNDELLSTFDDDIFAYHLQSRSLRKIDHSIVKYESKSKYNYFVPNHPNWKRLRFVRQMIRKGEYRIYDDFDMLELKEAMKQGLLQTGRKNKK